MTTRKEGLSAQAYEPMPPGEEYDPYVSPRESPAEFTAKALGAGIVFGILFGAANAYLGLRVGLTISTSIPVAVMTVAVFRALHGLGVQSTLLEANLSQTIGSASSSVASGRDLHPAGALLWGFDPDAGADDAAGAVRRPARRPVHDPAAALPDRRRARQAALSRGHGLRRGAGGERDRRRPGAQRLPRPRRRGAVQVGLRLARRAARQGRASSPAAAQEGRARHARCRRRSSASATSSGRGSRRSWSAAGCSSWLRDHPGHRATAATAGRSRSFPETRPDSSPRWRRGEIWTRYVRYIGAGAVATAGLITLIRALPTMIESFRIGARQLQAAPERRRGGGGGRAAHPARPAAQGRGLRRARPSPWSWPSCPRSSAAIDSLAIRARSPRCWW